MAVGFSAIFMFAALCGSEDKGAIFDSSGPNENMPVSLTGLLREGGGNSQHRCAAFGQRSVERGKAQVVANRKAQAAPRQIRQYRQLARTIVARFAIALAAGKIDVKHVDLVVARRDVAFWINQKRAVGCPVRRNLDR